MRLLTALLLAATLFVGCATESPRSAEVAGRSDPGPPAQKLPVEREVGQPEAKPTDPGPAKVAAKAAGQPEPNKQPGTGAEQARTLPAGQEKPLVIVSENPVFAGTGQLLEEIDKELTLFLDALETMDDITTEELNF